MSELLQQSLASSALTVLRVAYGALLLGTLLITLPHARRFFVSDRWRGYAESSFSTNLTHRPAVMAVVMALWFGCAAALLSGRWVLAAALVNLLLCRYYFVALRWKGVLRGMGAPGFMTYWLGAAVLVLEAARWADPSGRLGSAAILALRLDFAFIMLASGIYKVVAGYARGEGMEYGMVNPWWGYHWRFFRALPPGSLVFRALDVAAFASQIVAGLLMLLPQTRLLGAAIIMGGFLVIATQIRLGFLCEMVVACGILFVDPGSLADRLLLGAGVAPALGGPGVATGLHGPLTLALWVYAALLPVAYGGLFYNFLAKKRLPGAAQRVLDAYTNFFGIIIWRVFTLDVINFFVRIHVVGPGAGERVEYTRPGGWGRLCGLRYTHVGEFVCFVSLFTTLKYFPSRRDMFDDRLLRYARSIPCAEGARLVFEYVSIRKGPDAFDFVVVAELDVDPRAGTVTERTLEAGFSTTGADKALHEAARPGTYAPAAGPGT